METISIKNDIVPIAECKTGLSKWFKSLRDSGHPVIKGSARVMTLDPRPLTLYRRILEKFLFTHPVVLFVLITLGTMLPGAPPAASGEVYTWANADGTLGVADDVSKVPEKYRSQAKKVGEGEGGTGGVYYSKPQEQSPEEIEPPPPRRRSARQRAEVKQEPLITMEEKKKAEDQAAEKRKKDEEEIKKSWENMKKALAGH